MTSITEETLLELIPESWKSVLDLSDMKWKPIVDKLNEGPFCPDVENIFAALSVDPDDVRVVLIGQDPYHNGSAHGYSFSVSEDASIPSSLKNIHKELMDEYGIDTFPKNGSLIPWTHEGVLLLNTVLTVAPHAANSHKGIGWESFTTKVIEHVDAHNKCVFLAWGNFANDLCSDVVKNNTIVACGHPSPLNRSKKVFLGSNCFKNVNEKLMEQKMLPIRWTKLWNCSKI